MDPLLLPIVAGAVLALVLGGLVWLRLRGGQRIRGDMIERQRREAGAAPPAHPVRLDRVDQRAVTDHVAHHVADPTTVPEIRAAIAAGRKIEAVRLTRQRFGLGLKEAKDLIERHS